jgi:hypothetical protein
MVWLVSFLYKTIITTAVGLTAGWSREIYCLYGFFFDDSEVILIKMYEILCDYSTREIVTEENVDDKN